jgi:hypothetical protein
MRAFTSVSPRSWFAAGRTQSAAHATNVFRTQDKAEQPRRGVRGAGPSVARVELSAEPDGPAVLSLSRVPCRGIEYKQKGRGGCLPRLEQEINGVDLRLSRAPLAIATQLEGPRTLIARLIDRHQGLKDRLACWAAGPNRNTDRRAALHHRRIGPEGDINLW